jgi:hypothetical protein
VWFASNSREAGLRNREPWRWNSPHADHFAHVAQRRGSALKTRPVSVQIRPWAPPRVAQRRGTKLKPSTVQVQILPRGPVSLFLVVVLVFILDLFFDYENEEEDEDDFMECQPVKRAGPVC